MNAPTLSATATARHPLRPSALPMRWAALNDAAKAVAALAGCPAEASPPHMRDFPEAVGRSDDRCRKLAEDAVADMAAVMEPGLAALLEIDARGGDPHAAARALWREYSRARDRALALLPPQSTPEPGTAPPRFA
jgi:hypothetical protein